MVATTAEAVATKGTAQTQKVKGEVEKEAKVRETIRVKEQARNNGKEKDNAKAHAGIAEVCTCRRTARHIRRSVGAGQGIKCDPSMTPSEANSDVLRQ